MRTAPIIDAMGVTPNVLLAIDWDRNGSITWYSDKDILNIPGKILNIGEINEALTFNNSTNISVQIALDDTDSTIKNKLNVVDIQKIPCSIYLTVGDFDDKFLLFTGQVNSPVSWSEGDRSLTFTVVSIVEDIEAGFSPEDSNLPYVTPEEIDKPWPLVFGNVVHVPAVKVHKTVTGTLDTPICLPDFRLGYKLTMLENAYVGEIMLRNFYASVITGIDDFLHECVNHLVGQHYDGLDAVKVLFNEFKRICILQRSLTIQFWSLQNQIAQLRKQLKSRPINQIQAIMAEIAKLEAQIIKLLGTPELKGAGDSTHSAETNETLAYVSYYKEWLKNRIKIVLQLLDTRKMCQEKMVECTTYMKQWKVMWIEVKIEMCKEEQCVVNNFKVLNAEHFPSGNIDLEINGVKWNGEFSETLFTKAVATNLYTNVELDTWSMDTDECGDSNDVLSLNVFYIKDATLQLEGKYIRARSRRDDPASNWRHLLYVEKQVGNKCHFTLRNIVQVQGGNILQTPLPMVYPNINMFQGGTGSQITLSGQAAYVDNQIQAIIRGNGNWNDDDARIWNEIDKVEPFLDYSIPLITFPSPRECYTILGEEIVAIEAVSAYPLRHWIEQFIYPIEEIDDSYTWRADIGTTVKMADDSEELHVCNILPSTIKAVYAYKTDFYSKKRVLAPVPTRYYTKNEALAVTPADGSGVAPMTVTALRLKRGLSEILNEGWEDQLYVTLNSSVGPNICDIIQHLVETYTTCTVDGTSFANVHTKQELYPANFALLSRKNVKQLVGEIAWQARCSVFERNGVYYIKYLSEEPTATNTLTVSNIEQSSLILLNSSTDSIITCIEALWRKDYLPDSPEMKVKLRYNVNKYGLHKSTYDWYIYNDQALVVKSATFWLIRYANTWRHAQLTTFLPNIGIEVFDAVQVNTTFTGDVKGIVENVSINLTDYTIKLGIWLPVRAGETTQYTFAWPAGIDESEEFPTALDIELGYAGGNSIASNVGGIE